MTRFYSDKKSIKIRFRQGIRHCHQSESNADHSQQIVFSKPIIAINPSTRANKLHTGSDVHPTNSSNDYCTFLTSRQLVDLISTNSSALERKSLPVIIDCRSQFDYGVERIISSHNINCRAKLLTRKLSSKPLEEIESNLALSLKHADSVLLYDQSIDVPSEEKIRSSPLNLVIQAAKKSNKKVFVLQGRFDAIKSQYPQIIQRTDHSPEDTSDGHVPSTPDTLDKENFTMTQIVPHIFVGNMLDSQNLDRLNQNRITHIINCTPDLPCKWEGKYKYLRVDVLDLPSQNIRKHFEDVFQFIDKALRDKSSNILVHCSAGISRSPTLVLAYMIKKDRMQLDDAFTAMRQLRPIVDPNISFILQLQDWEKKCLSATSTTESNEVHSRPTSSSYCGSTSKSKTLADSAIIVQ
ncbi:unnamed protein product [Adineta ricciae]|uniref:protein-tyrosine-phosphatase n=1 Tax=Adineta ricciae TaxID=249248 RepID=A0A814ZIZ4_ADIRI|nr:unnamed protein product [Adineta ricciae]